MIAAAGSYGDDPARALLAKPGKARRSLAPCVFGLSAALGRSIDDLAPVLGASAHSARLAWSANKPQFTAAMKAAERAARFAMWRQEAKASEVAKAREVPVIVAEVAPITTPPVRSSPGRISSWMQPGMSAPAADIPAPLSDRVYAALAEGPASAPTLTHRTDGKELHVIEALRCLAGEGLVEAIEPPPETGKRFQKWRRIAA